MSIIEAIVGKRKVVGIYDTQICIEKWPEFKEQSSTN